MIKTYSIDGSEFQTVTLPHGTLLFRGVNSDIYNEYTTDNFCISPTAQTFFYPAPYVSQAVENYNIHIIYTTNYDLELLLLIKPATIYKIDKEDKPVSSIVKICSDISGVDKCGYDMSSEDPCFTDNMLKRFPHILGYIGLDKRDLASFLAQYASYMKYDMKSQIEQILGSIVSNVRGLIGVPEIAIHPLHLRRSDKYWIKKGNMKTMPDYISYIHFNRAEYNFSPLLYITKDRIFSFDEFKDISVYNKLINTDPLNYPIDKDLFANLNLVMQDLLTKGYIINGYKYNAHTDKKTGFYRINTKERKNTRRRYNTTLNTFDPETMTSQNFPLHYDNLPNNMTDGEMIQMAESGQQIPDSENLLNRYGLSFSPEYIFDKGNYVKKYRVDTVFPRPDLGGYSKRKKKNRRTRKN